MNRPPPITIQEYERRICLLREELGKADLDAFLAFTSSWFRSPGTVRYFCGYDSVFGSAMFVYLPATDEQHLLVNNFWDVIGRPEETERPLQEFHLVEALGPEVAKLLPDRALRVGIAGERFMPAPIYLGLCEALSDRVIVDATSQVDLVREVKSQEELFWLHYTASISDAAAKTFLRLSQPGTSERTIANEMLHTARCAGADGFWTPISVASGPRTALYYALPTERVLQAGDLVHTDLGVRAGGYHGDIQRARLIPGPSHSRCLTLLQATMNIQDHLVEAIRPGMLAGEIAQRFAKLAEESGHGDCLHQKAREGEVVVGHGIGSDGHESPSLNTGNRTPLKADMVVTLEPLLFIEGIGGVGVEDMVRITADGGVRLTQAPR